MMRKSIDDIFEYADPPKGAKYDDLRDKLKKIYSEANSMKLAMTEVAFQAELARTVILKYVRDYSANDDEVDVAVDVYNNMVDDFNAFCQKAAELNNSIKKLEFHRRSIKEAEESDND